MFFHSSKSYLDLGDLDFVQSGVPEMFKFFEIMQGICNMFSVLLHWGWGGAIPQSSVLITISNRSRLGPIVGILTFMSRINFVLS